MSNQNVVKLKPPVIKKRKVLRHHRMPTDEQGQRFANDMSFVLGKVYPGYLWQVTLNQDVVFIQNMSLNKEKGMITTLDKVTRYDALSALTRIGGEILERHKMERGKRIEADFRALKRDVKYNATPDMG